VNRSNRALAYCGVAGIVLLTGYRLSQPLHPDAPGPVPDPSGSAAPSTTSAVPPSASWGTARAIELRRPPSSIFEVGVLTDRTEEELKAILDRAALGAVVTPELCGDTAACDAVRSTLRDEHATSLTVVDASVWSLDKADVDGGARGLTDAQRAGVKKLARVAVVRVATATGPKQLALRAGIAGAAAIAQKTGGVVWDQLLERFESPATFAKHAVTSPLGASVFRADRVELLYQPKGEGVVRVLTSGLSRWGAPDVEVTGVPTAASARIAEIVLGVAAAIADGATSGPIVLSRDDLGRARGEAYPGDAGLPPSTPVEVDVVSHHPENADPNDFMARIEPPGAEGPIGALDLAERFFGPVLAAAPTASAMSERRKLAQAKLGPALARWQGAKDGGAKLLVLLPFPIPGDAGIESMWIEVTRFDGQKVTGKLTDEPLGATDVARGQEVTRPRSDVEDVEAP
jgi:Uncharacterized protein conserved in bacteria (DUF2314)